MSRRPPIPRVDVLGVGISAVSMADAVAEVARWVDEGERHYACVTGVHGVMESQRDRDLLRIHNASGLTTPDGMPMVWAGHRAGAAWMTRVYGPDLVLATCRRAAAEGWRTFFYGGKEGVADLMADRLTAHFPGLRVVGCWSPPFHDLTAEQDDAEVARINAARPDVVWVGLSTPKQERWMAAHIDRVDAAALIGVGAAFDIHAGVVPQAPVWMRERGLEWLYRLGHEPRRLWRRYLRNNPAFVLAVLRRPPRLVPGPEIGDTVRPAPAPRGVPPSGGRTD